MDAKTMGNPVAGANYIGSAPTNLLSELIFVQFQLVTDANVADRYPYIFFAIDANNHTLAAASLKTTASSTVFFHFERNIAPYTTDNGVRHFIPLPYGIRVNDSSSLTIAVLDIQAGDQISNLRALWNHWPGIT
jgi:hypothetical protein